MAIIRDKKFVGKVKARKAGNSIALTAPKKAGVSVGDVYNLTVDNDKLIYEKANTNPWTNGELDDVDFDEELRIVGTPDERYGKDIGREKVDW